MRFIASLLLVCLFWESALATNFYVRTDGHDGATGTNNTTDDITGAWLTADKAFKSTTVMPGDTVRFQAGTYPGIVTRNNVRDGTSGNRITFTCDGTVIIDLLTIQSDDYLTFHGFEVTTSRTVDQLHPSNYYTAAGILLYSTNFVIIEDCYVHNIPSAGIWLSGTLSSLNANPIVRRNRVARCQTGIWANSSKTSSTALFEANVITEPWRYLGAHDLYDTDYFVLNVGDQVTIQQHAHYGGSEDQTLSKGTAAASGSTGNTILATIDASSFFRRQLNNEIMVAPDSGDRTLKNLTTGASGTITAYTVNPTPGTQCTITATMTGGTRQNWAPGDVWYTNAWPHLDGFQMYANSSGQIITNCVIQDSYFGDSLECIIENQFGLNGLLTVRRCVFGPGFPFTVSKSTLAGSGSVNGPFICKDTNLLIENCTMFGWDVGPIYGWTDSDAPNFTWTARNNIGFNNTSVGWVKGSSPLGTPTRVEDYNLIYPTATTSPGAHDVVGPPVPNPLFVDSTLVTHDDALGADGLWNTADDGARLQAGSPARGAGLAGVDLGAYQYAAANTAPVVSINTPTSNQTFFITDSISFSGSAIDAEEGDLSSGITWTSSIDGALGTGASISHTLTAGTHTITASRTDSGSLTGTAQVSSVSVTAPPAGARRPGRPLTRVF